MRRVVIISGSKRVGNTKGIADIYTNAFLNAGFEVDLVALSEHSFAYCDGCLICDETNECVIKDGFETIIDSLRRSNLIIFGTPTRWRLMSGELKTFLDRLNPYAAIEGYAGLKAFVYAVGQSDESSVESINAAIESVCTFAEDAGIEILGKQPFCNLYAENDYVEFEEDIVDICKDNVAMLCDKLTEK